MLGGVPAPGEQVTISGKELVIEAIEGDEVASALVLPPAAEEAGR
jgi:hypothetical protein